MPASAGGSRDPKAALRGQPYAAQVQMLAPGGELGTAAEASGGKKKKGGGGQSAAPGAKKAPAADASAGKNKAPAADANAAKDPAKDGGASGKGYAANGQRQAGTSAQIIPGSGASTNADPAKAPDRYKHENKTDTKFDLSIPAIEAFNADMKKRTDALQKTVADALKGTLGAYAPNKIEFSLAAAVGGEGVAAPKDEKGNVTGKKDVKATASLAASAAIAYDYPLVKEEPSYDFTVGSEKMSVAAAFGANFNAGVTASATLTADAQQLMVVADGVLRSMGLMGVQTATATKQQADTLAAPQRKGKEPFPKRSVKQEEVQRLKVIGLSAEAQAEAAITLSANAQAGVKWTKKTGAAYGAAFDAGLARIAKNDALVASLMPLYKWLVPQGASAAIIETVMGGSGPVDLLYGKAGVAGKLGVGLSGKAGVDLGDVIRFYVEGSATWGLGVGATTELGVGAVNLGRLLVVLGAEALEFAGSGDLSRAMSEIYEGFVDGVDQLGGEFWGWLTADDKVREAVKQGVHKAVKADRRGEMVTTLLDTVTAHESELAILDILEESDQQGDLAQVLQSIGNLEPLFDKVDVSQNQTDLMRYLGRIQKHYYTVEYGSYTGLIGAELHKGLSGGKGIVGEFRRPGEAEAQARHGWWSDMSKPIDARSSFAIFLQPSIATGVVRERTFVRAWYDTFADAHDEAGDGRPVHLAATKRG